MEEVRPDGDGRRAGPRLLSIQPDGALFLNRAALYGAGLRDEESSIRLIVLQVAQRVGLEPTEART